MELSNLWFPIAILVTALLVVATVLAVRRLMQHRVPATSPEERAEMSALPMTSLQKRAWIALLLGLGLATAIVITIARVGPTAYFDDDDLRIVVLFFIFGMLASFLYVLVPTALKEGGRDALDERDKRILSIAPHAQAAACLMTVAAWTTVLTEAFRGESGIPTGFMHLMFWSVFIVYMLSHSIGILFGYWFAKDHGEG